MTKINRYEPMDNSTTVESVMVLPASGSLPKESVVEVIPEVALPHKARLDLEQFMNEPIEIQLAERYSDSEPVYVFCSVNGIGAWRDGSPWLPRGIPITIPRRHLEVLLRSSVDTVRTKETANAEGTKTMSVYRNRTGGYVPTVLHDPNPKGAAWMKGVMTQSRQERLSR